MSIEEAVDKAYLFSGLPKLAQAWQTDKLWLLAMVTLDMEISKDDPLDIGSTVIGVDKETGEARYCVLTPS